MTLEDSQKVAASTRPTSIVWYERLAWASLVIGLASAAANPAAFAKYYNQYSTSYLIVIACVYVGQLLWIWLIARKRQNWARWISLIVVVIGIPQAFLDIGERVEINAVAAIVFYLGFLILTVAVFQLFRSDAREWFARRPSTPDADPPS
jgi:hypothetical protein